ncbi:uncharacterized protein SEPMUDRAFT_153230 [Sphaerulina musiva SO2202]|uniref:Uncharacterized protein n=1 Tax=Sphaerulina musiva (strain SO2202) TaxID=692275 RepID=N1QML4_SPHMS|nr:uncharacterized protein SEPMUDRAFT_153230 [Sphaerulina musiva SO2202]EMF17213.1 hypothetical protein SEPMUDRAFT_153230 [Sphaerulina musiva SO2202]
MPGELRLLRSSIEERDNDWPQRDAIVECHSAIPITSPRPHDRPGLWYSIGMYPYRSRGRTPVADRPHCRHSRLLLLAGAIASSENQQHPPDPAPPSLSAGAHETRDYYAAQTVPRPLSPNEPCLTPSSVFERDSRRCGYTTGSCCPDMQP